MINKHSLLIIDDSKLINNSLCASLQDRGYEVTQAFDVSTAKEILRDKSFDYALLDLELPDGMGEDLLPFLQIHEEIRVIVMTSDRDKSRRENLFNFGIVIDYITKERYFADMELAIVQLIERVSTNYKLNMLVVDDSTFMRNQLRILLSKRGFKVFEAMDGKAALEVIKKHKIDGAIVDLEMPVMDGNKLLGAIKRNKANLLMPIMVVSGSSNADKVARVIKNGASDFIKKPFANEELLLKIDKMMQDLKQQRMIKVHEAKFATYNKAIDDAAIFFKVNEEFKIIYANDKLSELIYCDDKEVEYISFEDCVLPLDNEKIVELKKSIDSKEVFQDIFSFKNNDGITITLSLTFTPLFDENNDLDEILVIGFDVSLIYQKKETLQKKIDLETKKNWNQNKILIQQSKMADMGEMIGHIGHQWRQPLNSLSIIFQKLNRAYKKGKLNDDLMSSSTEKSMRVISQMSKTIDDFRDFFKIEKEWTTCKAVDVITQAFNIIEPTIQSHGIRCNIHNDNKVIFKCLKNELAQVLLNIIANAMDAIVLNEIHEGEISIWVENDYDNMSIIIDDNAGGIPELIIDRIFEPYFTTKEKTDGTGIGLYMSKSIIEEHMSGKLEVKNTLIGASFKIKVPLEQSEN